ncbi:MAG: DMT family transporter [Chromatiales bacterium]|nr:DMT family transporter [Chromatiales bacterium]
MSQLHFAILVFLAMLWGGSFLFMRIAAPVLGAVWLIEFRVLLAGLVLLPVIIYQKQFFEMLKRYRQLLIAGALNAALPFSLLAYAAIELSAGLTSILNATVPIFSALFAYLVLKEKIGMGKVIGIVLGFFGVIVLMAWRQQGELPPPSLISIGAVLLAAISYVLAANYTKQRLTDIQPLVYVTGSQLGAALLLIPLLPFFIPEQEPNDQVIFSVIALAVLSTSLAFAFYFHLIKQIGPTQTLTVTYLIPVFAILWGNWFLDEQLTLTMLTGCSLIIFGTALANGLGWQKLLGRAD